MKIYYFDGENKRRTVPVSYIDFENVNNLKGSVLLPSYSVNSGAAVRKGLTPRVQAGSADPSSPLHPWQPWRFLLPSAPTKCKEIQIFWWPVLLLLPGRDCRSKMWAWK